MDNRFSVFTASELDAMWLGFHERREHYKHIGANDLAEVMSAAMLEMYSSVPWGDSFPVEVI